MKKLLAAFFSACLLLGSCSQDTPQKTAEKYLNAMMRMDFETAKSVATDESRMLINSVSQLAPLMVNDKVREQKKLVKVKILKADIAGDSAVVTYKTSDVRSEMRLYLLRSKGRWLVETNKMEEFDRQGMVPENQQEVLDEPGHVVDTNQVKNDTGQAQPAQPKKR